MITGAPAGSALLAAFCTSDSMAVVDIAGFVADLKDHAVEHGFHVHDERHFVESYSLRPDVGGRPPPGRRVRGPGRPVPLARRRPRVLLGFEDAVIGLPDDEEPRTATTSARLHLGVAAAAERAEPARARDELAGVGSDLRCKSRRPTRSPRDDAPERTLRIVAHQQVSLVRIRSGEEVPCEMLDRCLGVSASC